MGWNIGSHGFKILLDPGVPQIINQYFATDVRNFLATQNLTISDIKHWICHPGGPKVMKAIESSLVLPENSLKQSWEQLAMMGNLSSSSVLAILKATKDSFSQHLPEGEYALVTAMGPGFCSEQVLCQWN
jgi:alkylresorcinol/alkylpyrone synthase